MFHVDIFIREISRQCIALCPFEAQVSSKSIRGIIIQAVIDVEIKILLSSGITRTIPIFDFVS